MAQRIPQNNGQAVRGVVLMGSARSDGNTRRIVERFVAHTGYAQTDLNDWTIGFFDYDQKDRKDDFIPLFRMLMQYDVIVFATPVYWYAMSALMKNFFDRITDLLHWHKELGRQLRGKHMAMISCGSDDDVDDTFALPFKQSADYLGMRYLGNLHTWVKKKVIPDTVEKRMEAFILSLETQLSASIPKSND
jgi:multimeric flavodoxin WrbA